MGVVVRGCHCHDPDKGFGRVGDVICLLLSRGGECCGQGARCRLAAGSPGTSPGKKDALQRHGNIHAVVSDCLPKNQGARECKYRLVSFSALFWWFYRGAPFSVITAV